ncbi:hypothetical protein AB0O31_19595 [Kitasatospora cineracea]|uniref:hypothetical protein n=1 Tax=Kitasatospora cineracea TaxID=88074 RepID=UPI0034134216
MRPALDVLRGLIADERLRQAVLTRSALLSADSTANLPFSLLAAHEALDRHRPRPPVDGPAAPRRPPTGPLTDSPAGPPTQALPDERA